MRDTVTQRIDALATGISTPSPQGFLASRSSGAREERHKETPSGRDSPSRIWGVERGWRWSQEQAPAGAVLRRLAFSGERASWPFAYRWALASLSGAKQSSVVRSRLGRAKEGGRARYGIARTNA
jgi:hypothetical protein